MNLVARSQSSEPDDQNLGNLIGTVVGQQRMSHSSGSQYVATEVHKYFNE